MEDEVFNLPTGKTTTDATKYNKAWRELIRPIEEATQTRCGGFDPDYILFPLEENYSMLAWHIPVNHALKLYKAITGKEFKIENSEKWVNPIRAAADPNCKDCNGSGYDCGPGFSFLVCDCIKRKK